MFNGLFDMDRPFWRWIGKLPEILLLSLCWYACCIPLVTFIPASCALYDAVSRNLVTDEKGCFKRFFRTFVQELKRGIPLSILWIIIILISIFGILIIHQNAAESQLFSYLFYIYLILFAALFGYLGWLIPLQSRFYCTFLELHTNALRLFFGRLLGTVAIFLITAVIAVVCIIHPFTFPLITVAPGLIAVFHTIPVEKAFRIAFAKFYENEEK